MLVALGSALFVLIPQQAAMALEDLSRVIQGIVTGVGFLGAGAILKQAEQQEVKGLTTAAGLWLTAAVGIAAGMGREASAVLGTFLAWFILSVLQRSASDQSIDTKSSITLSNCGGTERSEKS